MRVSTNQMQAVGVNTMLEQQSKLSKTQQQLSTGRRITKPSDDPVAASRILDLQQSQAISRQYQLNADAAISRLSIEETILADTGTQVQRVRELAIQGNNGSQSNDSRKMIASELRQIQSHLLEIANSKDTNGEYIFAGYQGDTRPFSRGTGGTFVYSGDEGQRFIQVGPTRRIADTNTGSEVFMSILNGNGTFAVYDNASNTGSGVIDPGSVVDPSSYVAQDFTILFSSRTDATATNLAAGAGALPDDTANPTDNALQYQLYINGVSVYTQDEGAAALTVSQLRDAINSSATNPGVLASVVNGELFLTNQPASHNDITIQERLVDTGATNLDATDTMIGYFGTDLTADGTSDSVIGSNITFSSAAADAYVVVDDITGAEVTGGLYVEEAQIQFNGIQTFLRGTPNTGDSFRITPSSNQDVFTTIQNLIDAFEVHADNPQQRAVLNNTVNRVLSDLGLAEVNVLRVRSDVGARMSAIDSQRLANDESIFQVEQTLSTIQDLDYSEAVTRLNVQLTGLQAAQQTYTKVQGLSLFNYL